MRSFLISILFCPLFILPSPALSLDYGVAPPPWTLKGADGKTLNIKAFAGKIVVIEFLNPQCETSRALYSSGLETALFEKFGSRKDTVWLTAVSESQRDEAKDLLTRYGIPPERIVIDTENGTAKRYGVSAHPTFFILNHEGVLIYQGAADNAPARLGNANQERVFIVEALDDIFAGRQLRTWTSDPYGCRVAP